MIDFKDLRENQDLYAKGFAKKGVEVNIPHVLKLEEDYRSLMTRVEAYRAEKNAVSKQIPLLPADQRQIKITEMKTLDVKLGEEEEMLNKLFIQLKIWLQKLSFFLEQLLKWS